MNVINNSTEISKKFKYLNFPRIVTLVLWSLFLGNLVYLMFHFPNIQEWNWKGIFRINGFTMLIWTTVTFFSAIVSSFASKYLKGFRYYKRFMSQCLFFTVSVMLLVVSEHVLLLLLSWLAMGFFMARLIGIDSDWTEAKEASKFAQK